MLVIENDVCSARKKPIKGVLRKKGRMVYQSSRMKKWKEVLLSTQSKMHMIKFMLRHRIKCTLQSRLLMEIKAKNPVFSENRRKEIFVTLWPYSFDCMLLPQ